MIKTRQDWCCFAVGLLLCTGFALAEGTTSDSFIEKIAPADANPPQVLMRSQGDQDWKPAQAGLELLPGDSVQTKTQGTCTIHVGGMAVVDLEPNSLLTIPGDGGQTAVSRVKVDQGAAWSTVRPLEPGESFTVETQHSVGGVKGTQFQTNVSSGGEAEWNLVEGSLQMTPGGGGAPFRLQPGQTTTFARGGALRIRPRRIANMEALRNRFQRRFGFGLRRRQDVARTLRQRALIRRGAGFRGPPARRNFVRPVGRPGQRPVPQRRLKNWRRRRENR